ncbi:MAG TPA: spore germination protein [Chondromyces sp.]|nr:spore germination protein [Chondromyces sp.]
MPVIIGSTQIMNIGEGIVHYGDAVVLSPKSTAKTSAGSGGFNNAQFIVTYSGFSMNPVLDTTGVDQPITGNN